MAKSESVSMSVIRRLPRYYRFLYDEMQSGVTRISSRELAERMGLTASQIRQDLNCFGEFGQQGYGYNVVALRQEIAKILGMDRNFSCVLVGVGNIGHALISHFNFANFGFSLLGAFDVKSDLIGSDIHGVPVFDIKELRTKLNELQPDAAILCLPSFYANEVAPVLVDCGIRGIWNFTNVELDIPAQTTVIENIYFSDSLLALGYYLSEALDEKAASEAKKSR
ncbi:MAG: redox-sensing transcriptional repressor Rex [Oscillospiraceae bacterium]|nr:redox-sensing transcriptional repressor Rex [Oscillospiraceae bacterium]